MKFVQNIEDQAQDHGYHAGKDHSCELDISKIQGDSGKTYDKDNRSQNEVSGSAVIHLVVNQHTKSGSSDHTIEQERNSANDRSRDRIDQGGKFAEERTADGNDGCTADHLYAVYFGHCHDADVFAIGCCRHGAETAGNSGREEISKKGTMTIKKKPHMKGTGKPVNLAHNRKKRYILEEGIPVPFLQDLGVMTKEGKIVRTRYDKFRQINRFLEFIEDILPQLPSDREITILDFGCGKSYLTFAMYYYFRELKKLDVNIIGLDLKEDVIAICNGLAEKYGYEKLHFYQGDIASYTGRDEVDMVVTLHACDTATDYALEKAVKWNAKVILSVPCCQHELNRQIANKELYPIMDYGILKERMAALLTDGIRAKLLENAGYETQILEFIDMEHTPKNLLIRAVKRQEGSKKLPEELKACMEAYHVKPTLADLLTEKEEP